jgi:hypothetical protein
LERWLGWRDGSFLAALGMALTTGLVAALTALAAGLDTTAVLLRVVVMMTPFE